MANKNTLRINRLKRQSAKVGQKSFTLRVPVKGYHSAQTTLIDKTFQVASGKGVISQNQRRNTQMVVLNNGGGANSSATVHEKIRRDEPANFKPKREKKD